MERELQNKCLLAKTVALVLETDILTFDLLIHASVGKTHKITSYYIPLSALFASFKKLILLIGKSMSLIFPF